MSPATPDNLDPTPMPTPIIGECPYCGRTLPPLALPVPVTRALIRKRVIETEAFPHDIGPQEETRIMRQDP